MKICRQSDYPAKSEYIIDLAHAINSGELDLDALHRRTAGFRNTLIGYRGIGDWTISSTGYSVWPIWMHWPAMILP